MKKRLQGAVAGFLVGVMCAGGVVLAKSGSEMIEVTYNNIKLFMDGIEIELKDASGVKVEPFIYNGTTYLPVRAVGEAFGKQVSWDGTTQSVYIGTNKEGFEYLFDKEPYLVDNANLYMRNNNVDTKKESWYYSYDAGWTMQSAGKTYSRGMSITPESYKQTKIYYNLDGLYSRLTGKIAFEDKYADRIDKSYTINFYADDDLVDTYTIEKGGLPKDINVNLRKCLKLTIELVRPSGDKSDDPNINLLEFELRK